MIRESRVLNRIDTFSLVCTYNTSYLYTLYKDTVRLYVELVRYENARPTYAERYVYREQIQYMVELIDSKMFFLIPSVSRVRRGLINGLGTIVKAITGNLDEEDAQRFEKEIEILKRNSYSMVDNQKQSIGLMKQFIDEYNENLNKIQRNIQLLKVNLDNINSNLTSLSSRIDVLHMHIQIENGFQQIYDRVSTLETAITFATMGSLHPSIVNPVYLLTELIKIETSYQIKLPLEPRRENMQLIQKTMKVKAYSTPSMLTFILEVPIVSPDKYDLLHLYSIPNTHNLTRIPKAPYLILGSDGFSYLHEPCTSVADELMICGHLQLQATKTSTDCVVQLIRHITPEEGCNYARLVATSTKIQQVKENSWLVIAPAEEILKTSCEGDHKFQRIRGVYLLTTTEKCTFTINEKTLQTHHKHIEIKETLPLPRLIISNTSNGYTPIKLEEINLDQLHSLAVRIHEVPDPRYEDSVITSRPSWISVTACAIVLLAILYHVHKKWSVNRCRTFTPMSVQFVAPRTPEDQSTVQQPTSASAASTCGPTPVVRNPLGREELCRL